MIFDGGQADVEFQCNLFVRSPLDDQFRHLFLARCQRREQFFIRCSGIDQNQGCTNDPAGLQVDLYVGAGSRQRSQCLQHAARNRLMWLGPQIIQCM